MVCFSDIFWITTTYFWLITILPIFSIKLYLIVFIGIKLIIDASLIKHAVLAGLLHLYSMINKGMAVYRGKFETLIGFDTCQDGEIKQTNREHVSD